MALLSEEMDNDLLRLWALVAELSDQLNNNRAMTAALQAQANQVKGQAIHSGTGFVLRRFNTDLTKEVFESELERMNATLVLENQTLLHENKQLSSLLKEYEQTLETVMAKFRAQAHAAQQHELTLTRHYESLLVARESNTLNQDLILSSSSAESLARLSHLIRMTLRSLAGEDPEADESEKPSGNEEGGERDEVLDEQRREGGYAGSSPPLEDWALEREIEITRLEKENEELRRLLTIGSEDLGSEPPKDWERMAPTKLFGNGPTRRGLLTHSRARGAIGRGGYTPHWTMPDPLQRKSASYFREFPT